MLYFAGMQKRTLQYQILTITIPVMMVIAIAVMITTSVLYQKEQRSATVNAAAFGLGLISADLERDWKNVEEMQRLVRQNADISVWLNQSDDEFRQVKASDALQHIYQSNSLSDALLRVAVFTADKMKVIQTGIAMADDTVTTEALPTLLRDEDIKSRFSQIRTDPYLTNSRQELPVIEPLYRVSARGEMSGYLSIFLSLSLLSDRFAEFGRTTSSGTALLRLGDKIYAMDENGNFTSDFDILKGYRQIMPDYLSDETTLYVSSSLQAVFYDLSFADVSLGWISNSFPPRQYGVLVRMILVIMLSAAFLLVVLQWRLGRMIKEPVEHILSRLKAIADSDFTPDGTLEYDSEFGEIGKGINELAMQIDALIKARVAAESEKKELEYRALQYQISPHFLNNTLNSIKWMATIQKAPGIAEMVTSLSHLLRSVSNSRESNCTIGDELVLLDDYLTIQKYRYADLITLKKDIPEEFLRVHLPRFTFQPIVENAIFHGITPKGSPGTISITAMGDGDDVIISISDDGVGMDEETASTLLTRSQIGGDRMFTSIGMENVDKRVKNCAGNAYGISVKSILGVGTTVSIRLPGEKRDVQI